MSFTRGNDGTVTRPLIQNPISSLPQNANISEVPSYYNFSSHSTNLWALNHHLADIATAGKSRARHELIEQPLGSSRWNPTAEQLLALEEMYRRGTRTPSAEQIQHIASQLRRFGKIEGKNVFYWFQNHKARERQKRRRPEIETNNSYQEKQLLNPHHHNMSSSDKKESGLTKTSYDIEQTKNWAPSSSCSKQSEEIVSMHRGVAESTSCGRHHHHHGSTTAQIDKKELQQIKSCTSITAASADVMNATWQKMEFPSSLEYKKLLKTDHHHHHHHQNLVGFSLLNMKPYQENFNSNNENGETQTLELFPLHSSSRDDGNSVKDNNKVVPITVINGTNNFIPSTIQYIEFLPLKH